VEVHGERVFALLYQPINAYRGVRVQDKAKGVEPKTTSGVKTTAHD